MVVQVVVVLIVVVVAVAAAGAVRRTLRARRGVEAAAVAAAAGLEYAADDPFECTRIDFALFRKGDGRGAENVMWKDSNDGHSYRSFDYWYFDEYTDRTGRKRRTYHYASCAMALVGSAWPRIHIEREGLVDKVVNTIAGEDIDFESEEFNRLFAVRCEDRRFANALLDPGMLQFLLGTHGGLGFELTGRWLLVWTSSIPAKLMPGLLHVAEQFVAHIPKVVWDLYPSDFVDGDGKPLPAGDDAITRLERDAELAKWRDDHDPFEVLAHSPFEALERDDGVEYDLDGHRLPHVAEDPWGDERGPTRG